MKAKPQRHLRWYSDSGSPHNSKAELDKNVLFNLKHRMQLPSSRVIPNLFAVVFSILLNEITPKQISWDGYLYLGSAKSLFTSDFSSYYHWIREPGYPFIIWICLHLGGLATLFIVQSILLIVSISLAVATFERALGFNFSKKQVFILDISALLFVHGYAAAVLQQTFFCLIISSISFLLVKYERAIKIPRWKLFFILILAYGLALNLFLSFVLYLVIDVLTHKVNLKSLTSTLIIVFLPVILLISSWYHIKQNESVKNSYWKGPSSISQALKINFLSASITDQIDQILQTPFSIINLAPDRFTGIQSQTMSFEQEIYGLPLYHSDQNCGLMNQGPTAYIEYTRDVSELGCVGESSLGLHARINLLLSWLLPIIGVCNIFILFFTNVAFLQLRKIYLWLALFLLPYIITGSANSRYGAPLLTFGVVGLGSLLRLRTFKYRLKRS